MQDRKPQQISNTESKEIIAVPAVREAWGLAGDVTPIEFESIVYGVKFNCVSGSPGYVGDIFGLHGDALSEVAPMALRRERDGHLIVC